MNFDELHQNYDVSQGGGQRENQKLYHNTRRKERKYQADSKEHLRLCVTGQQTNIAYGCGRDAEWKENEMDGITDGNNHTESPFKQLAEFGA